MRLLEGPWVKGPADGDLPPKNVGRDNDDSRHYRHGRRARGLCSPRTLGRCQHRPGRFMHGNAGLRAAASGRRSCPSAPSRRRKATVIGTLSGRSGSRVDPARSVVTLTGSQSGWARIALSTAEDYTRAMRPARRSPTAGCRPTCSRSTARVDGTDHRLQPARPDGPRAHDDRGRRHEVPRARLPRRAGCRSSTRATAMSGSTAGARKDADAAAAAPT